MLILNSTHSRCELHSATIHPVFSSHFQVQSESIVSKYQSFFPAARTCLAFCSGGSDRRPHSPPTSADSDRVFLVVSATKPLTNVTGFSTKHRFSRGFNRCFPPQLATIAPEMLRVGKARDPWFPYLPFHRHIQLVYRDMMTAPVASILSADYRMGGTLELLVIGASGEVRGYVPTAPTLDTGEPLSGINKKTQVINQARHQGSGR